MAGEIDFLVLYKILGLNADCELDEFKLAYRRRVAVLHPDRRLDGTNVEIAAERLQQLMALYASAMAFQRQHGRLPGAIAPSRAVAPDSDVEVRPSEIAPACQEDPQPGLTKEEPRRSRRWLIVAACTALIWVLWPVERPAPEPSASTDVVSYSPDDSSSQDTLSPAPTIALGMDAATVRARVGLPGNIIAGERWEYGPSWIRFDNDKVIDWYSSPLRPLDAPTHPVHGKD